MRELSILVPARNEMWLRKTVDDLIEHKEANTEILVGLDGKWADPPIQDHPDVTVLHYSESIGQRAITNQLARLSSAPFVMKIDAHCSFDQGFDRKMLEDIQPDWTMACTMCNLHVFDWHCLTCDSTHYQGPTPTECWKDGCPGKTFERRMIWKPRRGIASVHYRFDKDMHFQYWRDAKRRPENKGELVESLGLQGSMFMLSRDKYWELNICDEGHGSWGQQGVEVACKTWLSGGRVVITKKTWYAHLFRTQGGDFGFPYPNPGVDKAREYSRNLWLGDNGDGSTCNWSKAKYTLQWLLEKFRPVPDWHE